MRDFTVPFSNHTSDLLLVLKHYLFRLPVQALAQRSANITFRDRKVGEKPTECASQFSWANISVNCTKFKKRQLQKSNAPSFLFGEVIYQDFLNSKEMNNDIDIVLSSKVKTFDSDKIRSY